MKSVIRRHNTRLWLSLIALFTIGFGFYLASNPAFRGVENSALDRMFRLRAKPTDEKTPEVAIVMVDEKSIATDFGYYDPLPRRYLARLIDTIAAKGAKLIAVDIAFYDRLDQLDRGGDSMLVAAMRRAANVLSVSIWHKQEDGTVTLQNPDPMFAGALRGVGYANLQVAGGGALTTVRSVKPAAEMPDGKRVPAFSSLAYCLYAGKDPAAWTDEILNPAQTDVPLVENGAMIINFVGPPPEWEKQADGNWLQTKEGNILMLRSSRLTGDASWPADLFEDKLVIIGNGSEFVPDRFVTPYFQGDNWMYGAEVHANAFLTLLRGDFIRPLGWLPLLAILVILTLCMMLATVRMGVLGEIGVALILMVAAWSAAYLLFARAGLWVPAMSLSFTILIGYFTTSIYQAFTEEKNKRQIKSMFERYAPPAYVDQLVQDPSKLELGGEEKEISILFSDIEGFTSISENFTPKKLVELLNEYLGAMTEIIFQEGGSLDKYIGDAIVAVFGAPLPQNEHALHACYAALTMQKKLGELRVLWAEQGRPPVKNRIGINTGNVVFGNIGSDIRYDYTGIGDNMNLASRLEGANKQYGTYIMISEFTYRQVRERVIVRDLDVIVVKGKSKPVKVFELLGKANEPLAEETRKLVERYQEGIALYRERQWAEAMVRFEQALAYGHMDEPSKLYIRRCKAFIEKPPGDDWDGTAHLTSK